MKKFLVLGLFLSTFMLSAQEKVKEVVTEKYNRNSVSYIFVDRSHSSSDVVKSYETIVVSDKFDHNVIPTKYLKVAYSGSTPVVAEDISASLQSNNVGREVVSYIFNRKADGTFDDSRILERGLYDAKDQDIRNSAAAKVKDLSFEWGEPLVNSSYVIVVDLYKTETKSSSNGTTYVANANAHAYKLNGSREVLDNFYANAWADVSSSEEAKAQAAKAYNEMSFELEYLTTVTLYGSSSTTTYSQGSIYKACQNAYEDIVYELEKKIPAWQTATSIIAVRPLAAKIGKKENVKNGDRFQAYTYKEDKDGELKSVKRGMLRATVIADNRTVATGDTQPSYFYQISGGANIKEGYTIKQKNDLKLGASLALGMSPVGFRVGLDMDYIAHIGLRGSITYVMLNLGYNLGTDSLFDAMIGAGYGVPISRFFEVTPYIMGGAYLDSEGNPCGYLAEPGARLALTLQPFSLYVGLGYQLTTLDDQVAPISAKVGFKWTF